MKKLTIIIILFHICIVPVMAAEHEFTAPAVPQEGEILLPYTPDSFTDGVQTIVSKAIPLIYPAFTEALHVCLQLIGIMLLISVVEIINDSKLGVLRVVGTLAISIALLGVSKSMIPLGADTITGISTYGKLLLPVMASALAAQGWTTTSGALYIGTAFFDSVLTGFVDCIVIPFVYIFLALSVASCAIGENIIGKLKDTIKNTLTWLLKIILYIFTGYITISGAVSGSTDAMTMKAAKVTISGVVPVIGGILSDASEAVIVSAGIMKNAAGMYGILAILAMLIGPFLQIGMQHLVLKCTGTICQAFGNKQLCSLISDFSAAMGVILAATAAVSFMLVVSTVCFMKVIE